VAVTGILVLVSLIMTVTEAQEGECIRIVDWCRSNGGITGVVAGAGWMDGGTGDEDGWMSEVVGTGCINISLALIFGISLMVAGSTSF